MKHSAGVIIYNRDTDSLLMGHPTCSTQWDLFKGGIDNNEDPMSAAIRELREESGLSVSTDRLKDCGRMDYIPTKKTLHAFLFVTDDNDVLCPNEKTCKCVSYFMKNDIPLPEMNAFKWIKCKDLHDHVTDNLYAVLVRCLTGISPIFK